VIIATHLLESMITSPMPTPLGNLRYFPPAVRERADALGSREDHDRLYPLDASA